MVPRSTIVLTGDAADEELLLEGALLEDEDAGCGGARSGPGSRGSIEREGCVGAREG